MSECHLAARIIPVGCLGHCYAEPLVAISKPGFTKIYYHQVTQGKARALVRSFLGDGNPLFDYAFVAAEENDLIPTGEEYSVEGRKRSSIPEQTTAFILGQPPGGADCLALRSNRRARLFCDGALAREILLAEGIEAVTGCYRENPGPCRCMRAPPILRQEREEAPLRDESACCNPGEV
jgi:(2Fe-2S) ferredoxin